MAAGPKRRLLNNYRYRLQKVAPDGKIELDERYSLLSQVSEKTNVHRVTILRHLRGISKRRDKLTMNGWKVLKEASPRTKTVEISHIVG